TFRVNEETAQTLISGMGELQLEVIVNRLKRDMNVDVRVYPPQVSYRETITGSAEYEEEFKRQAGTGKGQYAKVKLRVEPYQPPADHHETMQFVNMVSDGAVRKEFIKAAETGIRDAAKTGVLAGYPMLNVKVTLLS